MIRKTDILSSRVMIKYVSTIFLVLFMLLCCVLKVNADDQSLNGIKTETVGPASGYLFSLKRLKEKTTLFVLSISKDKAVDYRQSLLEVRLSELYDVATHKDIANIEKTSLRYSATAGELTEFVVQEKLTNKNKVLINLMEKHIQVIEAAKLTYGPETSEWRFLHDDVNYLKTYITNLSDLVSK